MAVSIPERTAAPAAQERGLLRIPLRPLAASRLAREALRDDPAPRVAGVFAHGVVLAAGRAETLVFCGPRRDGLLPAQVVLRDDDLARLLAAARIGGSLCVADDGDLRLDGVRTFDVRVQPHGQADPRGVALEALAQWLRAQPGRTGLGVPAVDVIAGRTGQAFLHALRAVDADALREWIGRGSGSTPAGDDLLLGALAWQWHAAGAASPLAARVAVLAGELDVLTTRTSAAYLRFALQGRFAGHLVQLLDALGDGAPRRALARARRVAAHGASSGLDTLCGVLLASLLPVAR